MGGKVIVIGGGAAGAWSALAARRHGAEVALVRQSPGATALSSGCFDFAAERDLEGRPLSPMTAARVLARRRPSHPFAVLGESLAVAVREAIQFLVEEHAGLRVRGASRPEANLQLATPLGTFKETALAQGSLAAGDLGEAPGKMRIGVASFSNRVAFDAQLVASGLERRGHSVTILPPLYDGDARTSLVQAATSLDSPEARQSFVSRVSQAAKAAGVELVLLPTAGLREADQTIAAFTEVKAAELMSMPPSIPGLRLEEDLNARLAASHIERVTAPVRAGVVDGGMIQRLVLDDGREMSGEAFVLATGKFIGGGIRHAGGFHEVLFELPVFIDGQEPGERWVGDLLAPDAAGDQPALRAGVSVDSGMRPLDSSGRSAYSNLFAAGSVIGGFDPAKDRSGLGAIAVTAIIAGKNAAQTAQRAASPLASGGFRS